MNPSPIFHGQRIFFFGEIPTIDPDYAAGFVERMAGTVQEHLKYDTDIIVLLQEPNDNLLDVVSEINKSNPYPIQWMPGKVFLRMYDNYIGLEHTLD